MAGDHVDPTRVLVVDDHAVVVHGLNAFLDGEPDMDVVGAAGGGEEALAALADLDSAGRRPHVVVMDLQMERMDGVESTRNIRTRYDDVAVVVLTSFGEADRVRAALAAGASAYILKDSDAHEVAAAIRSARRGEVQLDPAVVRGLAVASTPPTQAELTARELEVLSLLAEGDSNKSIAAALGISERTARTHVSNILAKLGFSSRTQAALWAAREGFAERAP
jgi:DNA-binding NarL/FixJ family response regulator